MPVDGCRVAPYVNIPSMRISFDRQGGTSSGPATQSLGAALDKAVAAAAMAAVQSSPFLPSVGQFGSMLFYPTPHYGLNFALQTAAAAAAATSGDGGGAGGGTSATGAGLTLTSKNSSIADLRMKAKKYAAALGL